MASERRKAHHAKSRAPEARGWLPFPLNVDEIASTRAPSDESEGAAPLEEAHIPRAMYGRPGLKRFLEFIRGRPTKEELLGEPCRAAIGEDIGHQLGYVDTLEGRFFIIAGGDRAVLTELGKRVLASL